MSKAKHTPGPWKVIQAGNALGIVPKKRPAGISAREVEDIASLSLMDEQNDAKANARRICAAVNACEGLSTEALESGIVAELAGALRLTLDAYEGQCAMDTTPHIIAAATAALAKATGVGNG